jgi:hypothetical protein
MVTICNILYIGIDIILVGSTEFWPLYADGACIRVVKLTGSTTVRYNIKSMLCGGDKKGENDVYIHLYTL